jgi:hypothetical protein
MKNCNHCGKLKEETEFNWRYKALGIRHPTCRECQHKHNKKYFEGDAKKRHLQQVKDRKKVVRELAKEFVYQYLLAHPCSQCGEPDPRVLEFHHTGEKEAEISAMIGAGYSIQNIQIEIERCIVLCANCHRKITHAERGWFRGRK